MSKEKRFVIQIDPLEIEDDAIYDNKELRLYECQSDMMSDICSLLNKQEKRIAELEEQLKNAIVPKFKIGQEVYLIDDYYSIVPFEIDKILITENGIEIKSVEWDEWFEENECFITREEAQAKLEELQEK